MESVETLDDLLKKLLGAIPEVKSAAIVSAEGLPIASALPQGVDETRIAAMTAALLSLSERAIIEMNKGDFDQLYIKGSGQRIYGMCVKDVISREVSVDISTTKSTNYVISFFTELFKKRDIPKYLQMDNERSFVGDFRHKRMIGRFVKFLLHVGIEPIFVAQGKPWMNGSVEGFIRLFSEKFWQKKRFKSKDDVVAEAKKFEANNNALWQWKRRNADTKSIPSRRLDADFHFDPKKYETKTTKIHFIREVKSNGKIEVLNKEIDIGED